ncbi:MAG: M15 family metallopeptidase [Arachidicoccus sp.]|nr:M15 family metallopeptidase [Arachidicoccus sp.]
MHKIKSATLFFLLIVVLCTICNQTDAQRYKKNKYNLEIIDNINDYKHETDKNNSAKLVPLLDFIPHLKTDFVYATVHNFTHTALYKNPRAYALLPTAQALKKAANILKKKDLGIILFDAYRPYAVTEKMWEIEPDPRYAADPKLGSGHNRGIALDISLYKLSNGKLLKMPTGFDDFSDTAHSDYMNLDKEIIGNRQLLKTVMESCGFEQLSTEWWHFYIPNPNNQYKIINLSFDTLNKYTIYN